MTGCKRSKLRGYISVIGGIIVHLTLGTYYTFGNLLPYLASYLAWKNGNTTHEYNQYDSSCLWIYSALAIGLAIGLPIGGKCELYLGPRKMAFIGSFIMTIFGVSATYFTCDNLYFIIINYGLIRGFGIGLAYMCPLVAGMRWFPQSKGFVNGMIVFGFGAATTIFDIVMTELINPNNIKQDSDSGFLGHDDILKNVETYFLKISVIFFSMQCIGCMMISNPSDFEYPSNISVTKTECTNEKLMNTNNDNSVSKSKDSQNNIGLRSNFNTKKQLEVNYKKLSNNGMKEMDVIWTTKDIFKDICFWNLFFTLLLNALSLQFFSSEWKDFSKGQLNITNDHLLAMLGSVSSVFNGLGRILWGTFLDYNKSYKLTMCCMTMIAFILLITWPLLHLIEPISKTLMEICAFIWLSGLFGCICGSFSVLPTQIANLYGQSNAGFVYGYLFLGFIPASLFGTFGLVLMKENIGWMSTSWIFAGCVFISFSLSFMFKQKTSK
eukprot:323221_1